MTEKKIFTSWKQRMTNQRQAFLQQVNNQPKKFYLSIFLILIVGLLLSLSVVSARKQIQTEQLEILVFPSVSSKIIEPLTDLTVIEKEPAVTVVFSSPSAKKYQEMFQLISEKEKELNRSIYFYPIVYNVEELTKKYKVNSEQMTFVFFEKGVEKNRFTYEALEVPNEELMPELNRLPMWNTKTLETEKTQ